jgi:circadian clock protein KaiC
MYALTQWFATENVTCMLLYELHSLFDAPQLSDEEISNLSDNIVLLNFRRDAEMTRLIRIIKTRGSGHDHREHKVDITSAGMSIEK